MHAQRQGALATVDRLLQRLHHELASHPAHDTLDLRWTCHQVLAAAGDARAGDLLAQLVVDVRLRVATMTDEADRPRLIQAEPIFRAIVAAQEPGMDVQFTGPFRCVGGVLAGWRSVCAASVRQVPVRGWSHGERHHADIQSD